MSSDVENKYAQSEESKNNEENKEDKKIKGDIDDYIFSWQTIKYVSER